MGRREGSCANISCDAEPTLQFTVHSSYPASEHHEAYEVDHQTSYCDIDFGWFYRALSSYKGYTITDVTVLVHPFDE